MSPPSERKLAAIVCSDIRGYSGLMEQDEIGTLELVRIHRKELIDKSIIEHNGRIVKSMGDGLLIEFSSVVNAFAACLVIHLSVSCRKPLVVQGIFPLLFSFISKRLWQFFSSYRSSLAVLVFL